MKKLNTLNEREFVRILLASLKLNNIDSFDIYELQRYLFDYSNDPEFNFIFDNIEKTTPEHIIEYYDIENFEDKEPHLFLTFDFIVNASEHVIFNNNNIYYNNFDINSLTNDEMLYLPYMNYIITDIIAKNNMLNQNKR